MYQSRLRSVTINSTLIVFFFLDLRIAAAVRFSLPHSGRGKRQLRRTARSGTGVRTDSRRQLCARGGGALLHVVPRENFRIKS